MIDAGRGTTIFVSQILTLFLLSLIYKMRVLFSWFVLGVATFTASFASNVVEDDHNTEINALVSFPEDNPFGREYS